MPKGAIVGIVGANGAGKSTLFKMLSGAEQPNSGTVELGKQLSLLLLISSVTAWMTQKQYSRDL